MKATMILAGHEITFEGELDADGDLIRDIESVELDDTPHDVLVNILNEYFPDMLQDALAVAYVQESAEMAIVKYEEDKDWAAQRDWEG